MDLRRYRRIWPEGELARRRNRFLHLRQLLKESLAMDPERFAHLRRELGI